MTAAPPLPMVAEFRRQLRAAGGIDLVAVTANGVVAGWIDIQRVPWEGMQHVGNLGMGVRREDRGRGVGRALLAAALEAAVQRGITRIELEVFASNIHAVRLYESVGFLHEGRKIGAPSGCADRRPSHNGPRLTSLICSEYQDRDGVHKAHVPTLEPAQ